LLCFLAAGCATQTTAPVAQAPAVDPKLGVAPSPVVTVANAAKPLRKGGGRYHVGKPYQIAGKWYYPKADPDDRQVGTASWYGPGFHGRLTANGEIYDMNALTAAHPTMPLPSYARVTNLDNDRSVIVRVNDRGPFAHNRLIDLSKRTAQLLGFIHSGTAKVRVEYIDKAPLDGRDGNHLLASYNGPDVPSATSGARSVMAAYAQPPRNQGDQVSAEILTSGTPFDPYLALTDGQGSAMASRRFGRLPVRQAGFATATPLSNGQFVRRSYAAERSGNAALAAILALTD
jgi:rare lipoprotein A